MNGAHEVLLYGVLSAVRKRQAMHPTLPVTIVIIEDDPGHARLMERSLRRASITTGIMTLHEGQEA